MLISGDVVPTLKQVATTALIFAIGAAFGWAARDYQSPDHPELRFPFEQSHSVRAVEPGASFACTAIASANAAANVFRNAVVAEADPGTEKMAIRVTPDGKSLGLLTATAVELGISEDQPMPIIQSTKDYLVASQYGGLRSDTVFIDRKTLRGLWSSSGLGTAGLDGQSIFISCH